MNPQERLQNNQLQERLKQQGLTMEDSTEFPLTPDQAANINKAVAALNDTNFPKAQAFSQAYTASVAPVLTKAAQDGKVNAFEALELFSALTEVLKTLS